MQRTTPPLLALLAVAGGALASCGTAAAGEAFAVRDSASIAIAESATPAWAEGAGWRVEAEPRVQIGATEGPEAYQLHRVQGATRLADGTLVVANGGSGEVRFYDAQGGHLRSVGREGDGPGEYRGITALRRLAGDSLAVWDFRARRMTFLGPDGAFVRAVPLRGTEGMFPDFRGIAADGRYLIVSGFSPMLLMNAEPGERRDSLTVLLWGAAGEGVDTLGRFDGTEGYLLKTKTDFGMHPVLFGRSVHLELSPEGLWAGDDDCWEIVLYGMDGAPRRVVRRTGTARRAGRELVEAHWRAQVAEANGASPANRARVSEELRTLREVLPTRATLPFYQRLKTDAGGNLWVQEFRAPGDGAPRWSVFDPRGRWLGTVETPEGLNVVEIGPDWVLGTWHDEMDVQHVRLHLLRKPAV